MALVTGVCATDAIMEASLRQPRSLPTSGAKNRKAPGLTLHCDNEKVCPRLTKEGKHKWTEGCFVGGL